MVMGHIIHFELVTLEEESECVAFTENNLAVLSCSISVLCIIFFTLVNNL